MSVEPKTSDSLEGGIDSGIGAASAFAGAASAKAAASAGGAAMVGAAAYYEIISGSQAVDPYKLNILPRTPIK